MQRACPAAHATSRRHLVTCLRTSAPLCWAQDTVKVRSKGRSLGHDSQRLPLVAPEVMSGRDMPTLMPSWGGSLTILPLHPRICCETTLSEDTAKR